MPPFDENLEFGQLGESVIARWLRGRGSSVLPAYEKEIDTGKGPRLFTPEGQLVTPDLFVFPALEFIEAKHKTVFSWSRRHQCWVTGIDLHHYRDYQKTQQDTGRRVWLFFLHRSNVPDRIDSQHSESDCGYCRAIGRHCCPSECPTGLFGHSLDYLTRNENHRDTRWGRHGMVYWAYDVLKPPLATLDEIELLLRDAA